MRFVGPAVRSICRSLLLTITVFSMHSAVAGPTEQAKRIHDRIAGVPPDATMLANMEAAIDAPTPDPLAAALLAMSGSG